MKFARLFFFPKENNEYSSARAYPAGCLTS